MGMEKKLQLTILSHSGGWLRIFIFCTIFLSTINNTLSEQCETRVLEDIPPDPVSKHYDTFRLIDFRFIGHFVVIYILMFGMI